MQINPNYLVFAETPCGAVHVENVHPKIPQKVLDGSRRLTERSCTPEVFIGGAGFTFEEKPSQPIADEELWAMTA